MQLAGGLLSGNFGQGAAAYGATMAGAKDSAMKRQYMQSQIDDHTSQAEARKLAGVKDARQQKLMESLMYGDANPNAVSPGAFSPSADGNGPVMPLSAPQAQQQGVQGGLMGYARSIGVPEKAIQVDMATNGGKGIAEMLFKRGAPDMQVTNGYAYDKNQQKPGYMPSMNVSTDGKANQVQIGPDGQPVVGAPRGALETYNAYQGAAASHKPIQVYNPANGRMEFTNERAVVGGQPGALPESATAPGAWQAANPGRNLLAARPGESDQAKIWTDALAGAQQQLTLARTPEAEARAKSDIAGIQGEMRRAGIGAPAPSGNFAAGPSATEKLSNDAGGKVNESWLKTSYEPVIASIGPVNETLTSIKVARNSIEKMGSTGWGTEAKVTAASVLSGLGISSGNAKMYAANAQVFQKTAMDQLQAVLNQATGPQTDQDAARASQTFAKLGNVTEANKFILDLAEAKAQRDKMKADFYQKALPIARQKGDLQEVDREWMVRAPSVFNMPSMTAWGAK